MLQNNALIESAKKTINIEIEGLNSLIDFLDDKYIAALELMISCQGRVILSGMGKSGHIAKEFQQPLLPPAHHLFSSIQLKPVMVI